MGPCPEIQQQISKNLGHKYGMFEELHGVGKLHVLQLSSRFACWEMFRYLTTVVEIVRLYFVSNFRMSGMNPIWRLERSARNEKRRVKKILCGRVW